MVHDAGSHFMSVSVQFLRFDCSDHFKFWHNELYHTGYVLSNPVPGQADKEQDLMRWLQHCQELASWAYSIHSSIIHYAKAASFAFLITFSIASLDSRAPSHKGLHRNLSISATSSTLGWVSHIAIRHIVLIFYNNGAKP